LIAVKNNYISIRFIEKPCDEVQLEAVKKNKKAIQYIKNPSLKVQLEAVKKRGYLIKYIKNPSLEVQLEAVKQNGKALRHIENPSKTIQETAIKQRIDVIEYVKNPSIDLQILTVKRNGNAIKYINNPSEVVQLEAIKENEDALQFIDSPTLEVQLECVKRNGLSIQFIKEPSIEVQIEAVKQNENAIQYIEKPSLEIQWVAVQKNPQIIDYIKDLFPEVQREAINALTYNVNKSENNKINEDYKSTKEVYFQNKTKNYEIEHSKKEYKELVDDMNSGNFIILNKKESVDAQLKYLAKFINVKNLYIASGFVYKSGMILLEDIINTVEKNLGKVNLIIGSLQNYNLYQKEKEIKFILGMDKSTAIYLNQLVKEKNVEVRTLEEAFYHGKFYLLEGKKKSYVLIGSSNVSNTAFNINIELKILYSFDNDDEGLNNFKNWFTEFWKECINVDVLDENYFNDIEIEYISNYSIRKMQQMDVINRINDLTDEQLKFRLNLWLKKKPENIYTDLQIDSLSGYILFEFKQYKLLVFESFESGNAYYCFRNKGIEELLVKLKSLSKTEIFELSDMRKRGYHINDKMKLESKINSMFIRKYKIKN